MQLSGLASSVPSHRHPARWEFKLETNGQERDSISGNRRRVVFEREAYHGMVEGLPRSAKRPGALG